MEDKEADQSKFEGFALIIKKAKSGYAFSFVNEGIPDGDVVILIEGYSRILRDKAKKSVSDNLGFS